MRSEMSVLAARDIHKSFAIDDHRLHILRGVDLIVDRGELVGLMGPSGSGKSTLLNILGTLDQPDKGEVTIGGQAMSSLADEALSRIRNREIGFVFQFHHLLPELSLWENMIIPIQLAVDGGPASWAHVEELLDLVGLADRLGHYPSQLSGGERQRAAVVRALVNKPRIVLADEPTGNLDAENGAVLLSLIERFRTELSQSFLIATHSEEVAQLMDRRYTLQDGVIQVTMGVDESKPAA